MSTTETGSPFTTHEVLNQPPPLENYNSFNSDEALLSGVKREGKGHRINELEAFGERTGQADFIELGNLANKYIPELQSFDRFGHRLDEVSFHPAWHSLMKTAMAEEIHALPWNDDKPGAHVTRAAKHYLMTQVEAGHLCPITMTFAAVPALQAQPEIAAEWLPRITSKEYDPRMAPAPDKTGCIMGMAMTEKQGGSDVRANTTQAVALGAEGPGEEYHLTGHKWFCSAPMCDAFLTLAQTEKGLSCFIVPRWLPDGSKNRFFIQRLKSKLGNRSNASSEIEYHKTWARMVGEEGRGVPTIIEMVNHTRLDCVVGSAALMRQAVAQAIHHCSHRSAFGKRLVEQPLMLNVLADLALESEAATTLMLRLARAYDESRENEGARPFMRIATAIGKYWVCKRGPGVGYEALECHGGNGYVEEGILSRIYREMPLASIWEGSGNVMALDVLRAIQREPESVPALLDELRIAQGENAHYDAHLKNLEAAFSHQDELQTRARKLVEMLAVGLQAGLLIRHAPAYVAEAFCASRLADEGGHEYGCLRPGLAFREIVGRAAIAEI